MDYGKELMMKSGNRVKGIEEKCGFERRLLNGEHNISLPNLVKLCKELNVSADYLLFGK